MQKTINLGALTPDEKQELLRQLQAEEAAKEAKVKAERDELKMLTDESIIESFEMLRALSLNIGNVKRKVYDTVNTVIELKRNIYNSTREQYSHTFTSSDGMLRIIIGYNVCDDFDDSATAGIDGVNQFLTTLGVDDNSKMLVKMAKQLLAKDAKGNLNARKVMQLAKMANESGHKAFIDNVQIIVDAYRPVKSKVYIIAKQRTPDNNEWKTLPLGITEAPIEHIAPQL